MNYKQLADNIDTERIDWEQSDKAIADALNAITESRQIQIRIWERDIVRELPNADARNLLRTLELQAELDPIIRVANRALQAYGEGGGLDLGHENTKAILAKLVTDGQITEELAKKIAAMAVKQVQKYPTVTWQDVEIARKRRVIE